MFKEIRFIKSIYELKSLPEPKLPQLILCGRSNVGKSSFINSIFNRKNLAKTSSTPGKTRSINFYNTEDIFYIVDLPGFGYAQTSIKEREKWGKVISKYILNTSDIRHAFHFIDCRYDPTELDVQLNSWLKAARLDYTVILNKIDKLAQSRLNKSMNAVQSFFPELKRNYNLFPYSSVEGKWKKPVQKRITNLFTND
jgi:GTP-binding protein